jgi:hypothetical protein
LNNYYLLNEGIKLWKNYNKFWIQSSFEFFNGYRDWAKKWLYDGNIPTLTNVFGLVSMVEGVDVIGSSIIGEKQMTVALRYHGQKNSPRIIIEVGAIKFEPQGYTKMFDDVIEIMKRGNLFSNFNWPSHYSNALSIPFSFENDLRLSGTSIVKMNWVSPNMVNVNLSGNTTLYDPNIIGIRIHN